ncbi:MAG: tetratricopeptide repeat protein [Elusimicrobiota bacterium]
MDNFTRHNLNKNELAEIIVKAIEWFKNNRNLVYGISATALGIVIIAVFFVVRMQNLKARGEEKLAVAQGLLYQGQPAQGMGLLDEVINSYTVGGISYKARIIKSDFLAGQKNYEEAEKVLIPVTLEGKPKKILPLAFAALGSIQESEGKYPEAAATYNTFLDKYPDHFLAPKVYESLARVHEMTGAVNEARAVYEKISTLYPASAWSQRAQERISILPAQQSSQQQPVLELK